MSSKAKGSHEETITLDVSILGRDYKVACKAHEEAELRDAVALLETRMRDIRENSKSGSVERVAVMAALNLAHDVQRRPSAKRASTPDAHAEIGAHVDTAAHIAAHIPETAALRRRIAGMQSAIDQILPAKEKLF